MISHLKVARRSVIASTEWLKVLWSRRENLQGKIKLIAWGMKDIAFREKEMKYWKIHFPEARVVAYQSAGHFVPEEMAESLAAELAKLLGI